MTYVRNGHCRIYGCSGRHSTRSNLCQKHIRWKRQYGHPEIQPPRAAERAACRREAERLLAVYGDRKATHEALRLAGMVYTYEPRQGWTRFLKVQTEALRLRERADPGEVLTRTLAAYLAIESPHFKFPDGMAEHQHVGRVVLAPLWQHAGGRRYLLTGRLVSDFGEHVSVLLSVYCRGLIRKAAADKAERQAAIARSLDFSEGTP